MTLDDHLAFDPARGEDFFARLPAKPAVLSGPAAVRASAIRLAERCLTAERETAPDLQKILTEVRLLNVMAKQFQAEHHGIHVVEPTEDARHRDAVVGQDPVERHLVLQWEDLRVDAFPAYDDRYRLAVALGVDEPRRPPATLPAHPRGGQP